MFGRRQKLALEGARAEASSLESEVWMLRRMLDLSRDLNEARDRELTALMQSVVGLSGELRDAQSALDLALQGCIDREAVTAPVQVAGSLYDEAVES